MTHLHVVHHELVGELGPVLRVRHLLVHEAVDDGDAAERGEGLGDLLVKLEVLNIFFLSWRVYSGIVTIT